MVTDAQITPEAYLLNLSHNQRKLEMAKSSYTACKEEIEKAILDGKLNPLDFFADKPWEDVEKSRELVRNIAYFYRSGIILEGIYGTFSKIPEGEEEGTDFFLRFGVECSIPSFTNRANLKACFIWLLFHYEDTLIALKRKNSSVSLDFIISLERTLKDGDLVHSFTKRFSLVHMDKGSLTLHSLDHIVKWFIDHILPELNTSK